MRFVVFFFIAFSLLLVPQASDAVINIIYPPHNPVPPPATEEEKIDYGGESYFQWSEVAGTGHYELIIQGVAQRADNIEPTACSGGECRLWFLDDSRPTTIDCANTYLWRVEAYDASDELIDWSDADAESPGIQFWSFTTKDCGGPGAPPEGPGGPGGPPSPAAPIENPISSETLPELLENVLNFLFGLAIVILPIVVIYAGILLLGSGGDPQKVSRGKTILLWAAIAFAVILLARGLPVVLRGLL